MNIVNKLRRVGLVGTLMIASVGVGTTAISAVEEATGDATAAAWAGCYGGYHTHSTVYHHRKDFSYTGGTGTRYEQWEKKSTHRGGAYGWKYYTTVTC